MVLKIQALLRVCDIDDISVFYCCVFSARMSVKWHWRPSLPKQFYRQSDDYLMIIVSQFHPPCYWLERFSFNVIIEISFHKEFTVHPNHYILCMPDINFPLKIKWNKGKSLKIQVTFQRNSKNIKILCYLPIKIANRENNWKKICFTHYWIVLELLKQ